jgi:myo-inositol 2-dehydrogenase/D-chiro-inositol 1-dehydrogenase
MDSVRVGLIGCGQQATWIIHPSVRMIEEYDLVACCDIHEEAASAAGRRLGVTQVYTDYGTMLSAEALDAVIVVTSPENHAQIVSTALDAGLHVFVEKPPVKTVSEAVEINALSDRTGKHVMVGFMMRFRPFNQHVGRIAESMEEPPVLLQLSASIGPARSKVAGYPPELYLLLSVGIHYFDLIRWLMGDIRRVSTHKHAYNERQVAYAMMLVCDRGTCLFNLSSCERLGFTTNESLGGQVNERYHLVGSGESLYLENCEQLTWLKPNGETEFYQPSHLGLSFLPGQAYYQGGYYQEMREFAQSVLEDRPPSVTIADGLKATTSVFAAYESAGRGGEWIDVPD